MRYILFYIFFIGLKVFAQSAFDIYGPFNSEIFKDYKAALKAPKAVFKLDLSYQPFETKGLEKIGKLENLMNLQLNSNNLNGLPESFCNLHQLVFLSSLNNNIKSWPCSFASFPNLQYIEIGNSKIDTLPNSLVACQYLKVIKVYGNGDTLKITKLLKYNKKLNEIVFENIVADSCPKSLFKISSLRTLVLNNANTWYLPDNLNAAENLEVLAIENSPLKNVPWNIYHLKKLRVLSFQNTKITKLPDSISELKNLEYLDLRGTRISKEDIEILKVLLFGVEIKF